ncbi:hypothetical protein [Treponema sp. Marseille-Q4130]|uniref:hypothetical protein n=1 Tax=Treponema sp. Marseille-Q4130 TaxID=2766702 RepID=UPI0016522502|nr:hypothetical protein [Treponema sp. Marseille-Q4130]MBC6720986.1 hypothetical protein [Treponema sp. Marseille-Q4130]
MRKIIFITSVFILISLSACNITEPNRIENATVTNKSSITPIDFKTDGITYSVPSGVSNSITIQTRWTDVVELLNNPRALANKYYDYANGDKLKIDFVDMPVYKFKIKNNSNSNITLKEANNLLTDTYGGTLTLTAHAEEQNVNIYTEQPLLSVVTPTDVPFVIKRYGKVIIIE